MDKDIPDRKYLRRESKKTMIQGKKKSREWMVVSFLLTWIQV